MPQGFEERYGCVFFLPAFSCNPASHVILAQKLMQASLGLLAPRQRVLEYVYSFLMGVVPSLLSPY